MMCDAADQRQVVRDEQQAEVVLGLEPLEHLDDGGLWKMDWYVPGVITQK